MSKAKDEAKRERILQAAARVFARKGYTASKINDIARESQVADGTIYLYYRNKKDLLQAVFEHNMTELIPRMKRALQQGTHSLAQLRIFMETHLILMSEHRELSRGFQLESQSPKLQEYYSILSQIIHDGQQEGLLRPDFNENVVKRVLVSALSVTEEPALPVQEKAGQVYELLVGGLAIKAQKTQQKATLSAA